MLRSTVITTMTVSQVFVEIFEGFVPFLMYRKRTKNQSKKFETLSDQMKYEKLRDEYEGKRLTLNDLSSSFLTREANFQTYER